MDEPLVYGLETAQDILSAMCAYEAQGRGSGLIWLEWGLMWLTAGHVLLSGSRRAGLFFAVAAGALRLQPDPTFPREPRHSQPALFAGAGFFVV